MGRGGQGAGARENRGQEGYGRREKKGREAGSLRWREAGEKFKKASFRYLLLLTSNQRNEPNNVSWLPSNVLRGLKQKSRKTKIRSQGKKKKQHYSLWNWKPSRVAYIIGHEWDGHMYTSRSSQSIKIGFELSIDKSIEMEKRIWLISIGIDQSVEIDDTLVSFIDLSWFLPISSIYIGV